MEFADHSNHPLPDAVALRDASARLAEDSQRLIESVGPAFASALMAAGPRGETAASVAPLASVASATPVMPVTPLNPVAPVAPVAPVTRVAPADWAPGRTPDPPAPLTPRESEVLIFIAAGLTNGEIGHRLGLSVKTVMHHSTAIYRKLRVRGRTEATAHAYRTGMLLTTAPELPGSGVSAA